jgi:hypothetical protein
MDNRYLKKWFCAPGYDRKMKKMYQEMTLAGHMNHCKILGLGQPATD